MNKNRPVEKDFNIEESNQETEVLIKIVKISEDLEMIKDESGVIYEPDTLHFYVPKGGKVRHALRDAMGYLKSQKDKSKAVFKYKEFEVSFRRDEKFADVLGFIYAVDEFMQMQIVNPNFSSKS